MKRDEETSAVEGVGSRDQGNIQTQGESNLRRGSGKTRTSEYCTATGGRTGDATESNARATAPTSDLSTVNESSRKTKKKKIHSDD